MGKEVENKLDLPIKNPMWKFLIFVFLGILPLLPISPFTRHVIFMALFYAYLGIAWDLLGGFTGQGSFVHAAFVGLGAYTSTLLYIWYGYSPYITMFLGILFSVGFALFIGYLCFRFGLKGHFFFLASIAFLVVIRYVFTNWDIFGGATGLIIPRVSSNPELYMQFGNRIPYCYIILSMLIIEIIVMEKLLQSKLGYYFVSIREDESAAESLGVNTLKYKLISFAISAAFTSAAGTVYAFYVGYIAPDTVLSDILTVYIVIVAVLGGVGTIYGSIVGAFILEILIEYTRVFFGAREGIDLMILGFLMMLIGVMYPYGLIKIFRMIFIGGED